MNAICLVVDRLHVGYLGCYGNSWIATPYFDRLAAEAFLFDQALIESPALAEFYASLSSGTHALSCAGKQLAVPGIVESLAAAGRRTTLVTDDHAVAALPWAETIDELIQIDEPTSGNAVDTIADTHLARFFAVINDVLAEAEQPFCLWAHTSSLGTVWDAPREFGEQFDDEDDPAVAGPSGVPAQKLPDNYDPDELLAVCHTYAGQVCVLDACLGALLEEIERIPAARDALLVVLSPRGFPLGEHGRLGAVDDALHAELVHVPWLVRFPDRRGASERSSALVQPCDLATMLLDCQAVPQNHTPSAGRGLLDLVDGTGEGFRDRSFVLGRDGQRAVRTPAWYLYALRETIGGIDTDPRAVELYAKPDDRWDMNNVADRCPDVVELLTELLRSEAGTREGEAVAPLAEVLLSGLD